MGGWWVLAGAGAAVFLVALCMPRTPVRPRPRRRGAASSRFTPVDGLSLIEAALLLGRESRGLVVKFQMRPDPLAH